MSTFPIKTLDPLNSQLQLRKADAEYVQEVIYYCDSRIRAAMCRLHGLPTNNQHKNRLILVEGVAMELVRRRLVTYYIMYY